MHSLQILAKATTTTTKRPRPEDVSRARLTTGEQRSFLLPSPPPAGRASPVGQNQALLMLSLSGGPDYIKGAVGGADSPELISPPRMRRSRSFAESGEDTGQ